MTQIPADQPDIEGAISLLDSEDEQVRQFTAYLLGQAGDPRAIEPLVKCLADPHPGVKGAAANALAKIADASVIPHLQPLLRDDNPQLVVWGAFALTKLGEDHFDILTDALKADNVDVRRSAVLALRQLEDPRSIEPLLSVLGDQGKRFASDNTVEDAARKALNSLGYQND